MAPSRRPGSTMVSFNGPWAGPALGDAAFLIASVAKLSSARWSRRVPLSIRVGSTALSGSARKVTITAGGPRAPQAYTMEGRSNGRPIAHPVYGHGERLRGPGGHPPGWTWAKQIPVRPFMAQAADAAAGGAADEFATKCIDDWARASGFR